MYLQIYIFANCVCVYTNAYITNAYITNVYISFQIVYMSLQIVTLQNCVYSFTNIIEFIY